MNSVFKKIKPLHAYTGFVCESKYGPVRVSDWWSPTDRRRMHRVDAIVDENDMISVIADPSLYLVEECIERIEKEYEQR